MLNVLLNGCCGRMGQSIARQLSDNESVKILAGVDPAGVAYADFPVYRSLFDVSEKADVIIDFSNHSGTGALLEYALRNSLPVVLSTTGHTREELVLVEEASKQIPVFRSANMSLGINVLMTLCKNAAEILKDGFDIEIVEMHHNQKLDAPSGTALLLADGINSVLEERAEYVYDRHSTREKRTKHEIGMHAIRGGTVVGEHSVIFAGTNEVLTLSHSAGSREVFASGAIKAAEFLVGQKPGLYNMDHMISQMLG